ncbi:hypothetical protein [Brucella anthropi]|uniref:hypothetical protein n=1 Tax=Brucella anthropi TaxID=529 RepID=UPI00178C3600|nr:hypothetical protein [Brucella anthropi]
MLLHEGTHFIAKARRFSILPLAAIGCGNPLIQALRHIRLLEKAPALTAFLFEQDTAGAEFFQKPISPPDFQIGSQIIDLMKPCRRALACKLQVLHMIIHPRDFGLE